MRHRTRLSIVRERRRHSVAAMARSISRFRWACFTTSPTRPAAIRQVASKLKRGAPFLIYLYYALDNRPRVQARVEAQQSLPDDHFAVTANLRLASARSSRW